jgi:hypothetical protein
MRLQTDGTMAITFLPSGEPAVFGEMKALH